MKEQLSFYNSLKFYQYTSIGSKIIEILIINERPNATFCTRKHSVLSYFRYAELLTYYTFENKSNKTSE